MRTINKNIDTWNLLVKLRDTTKCTTIKEKCEMFLRQINTPAGNKVKDEANLFLDSCNALPVIYETGATSHAVNDLILFTDNTRGLAELRDKYYNKMHLMNERFNRDTDFNSLEIHYRHLFYILMLTAMRDYKKLFPNKEDHKHIWQSKVDKYGEWTDKEDNEYCRLYLIEFDTWKSEHGYK